MTGLHCYCYARPKAHTKDPSPERVEELRDLYERRENLPSEDREKIEKLWHEFEEEEQAKKKLSETQILEESDYIEYVEGEQVFPDEELSEDILMEEEEDSQSSVVEVPTTSKDGD